MKPLDWEVVGKLVKSHGVLKLVAQMCKFNEEKISKLDEGLGDHKLDSLDLSDVVYHTPYTPTLLLLLPHANRKLDIRYWAVGKDEERQLQERLDLIGSPDLTVLVGDWHREKKLKAAKVIVAKGDQEPSTSGESVPKTKQLQGAIQDPQEEGATRGELEPSTSVKSILRTEQLLRKTLDEMPQGAVVTEGEAGDHRRCEEGAESVQTGKGDEQEMDLDQQSLSRKSFRSKLSSSFRSFFTSKSTSTKVSKTRDVPSTSKSLMPSMPGDQEPSTTGESIPEAEQMWSKIEEPQAAEATGGDQEPSTSGASIPKFEQLQGIIQDPQEEGATGGEPSTSVKSIPKTELMFRKTLDEMPHGAVVTEGNESEESSQEIGPIHEFDTLGQQRVQPSSAVDKGYLDFLESSFHAACLTTAYKKETITPQGGSISLYGCELIFSEGEVDTDEVFELSVDNNPDLYPKSVMPVTLIIGCKPSKFRKPVKVRLASWFRSEDEQDIKVNVFSRSSSKRDWEAIGEANLTKSGFIEFDVLHFCKIGMGVPHDKAKKGLIHYHNDVWMHLTKGYILSHLCHDQKSIDQWKKELASHFRRIVALPPEMLTPINGSIDMSISCVVPRKMEMEPDSRFPFTITEEQVKLSKLEFYFKPKPHPSKLNHTGLYDFNYVVEVKDSQGIKVEKASRSIPLDYEWQGTASSSGQASVAEQNLSEDQPSNTPSNQMSLRSSQTSTAKEATAETVAFNFPGSGENTVNIGDNANLTLQAENNCPKTNVSVAIHLSGGDAQKLTESQTAAKIQSGCANIKPLSTHLQKHEDFMEGDVASSSKEIQPGDQDSGSQLEEYLKGNDVPQWYIDILKENDVEYDVFHDLTEDDLQKMGFKVGPQRKLKKLQMKRSSSDQNTR